MRLNRCFYGRISSFCSFDNELVTGTNLRKKQDFFKMENNAKAGIRTIKGFKVNQTLFDKFNEKTAEYEGGEGQYLRDILAKRLFNEIDYNLLSETPLEVLDTRVLTIWGMVDADTAFFFKSLKDISPELLVGEILTRFANTGEVPVFVSENSEAITKPETVTTQEAQTSGESQESLRTITINLDEIGIDSVRESLEKFGFEEMNYLTLETEMETKAQFEDILKKQAAEKDEAIHILKSKLETLSGENWHADKMAKDFAKLVDFTRVLIATHVERNGVKGLFSKYTKEHILSFAPAEFKNLFV